MRFQAAIRAEVGLGTTNFRLVTKQTSTIARTQLGQCGTDMAVQISLSWIDRRGISAKDAVQPQGVDDFSYYVRMNIDFSSLVGATLNNAVTIQERLHICKAFGLEGLLHPPWSTVQSHVLV